MEPESQPVSLVNRTLSLRLDPPCLPGMCARCLFVKVRWGGGYMHMSGRFAR